MNRDNLKVAIEQAISTSKERNFVESVELILNIQGIDLKSPSNRFRVEVVLPHAPRKTVTIAIVGNQVLLDEAKKVGASLLLNQDQITALGKNPKDARQFTKSIDFVLAMPQLMGIVGKNLGKFLGPTGKTPSVIPPNTNILTLLERYARTCKLRLRQNPLIQVRVGTRDMPVSELLDNTEVVYKEVENRMPQGSKNITKTYVKTTMGLTIMVGESR